MAAPPFNSELLQAIADSTDDAIFAMDLDLRYILLNKAAEQMTGKTCQDVLGLPTAAVFPAQVATYLDTMNQRVMDTGVSETAEESVPLLGGIRTFHIRRSPLYDTHGKIIGMCGIAHDITARKAAEQALTESEERLSHVLLATQEAIWDCDLVAGRVKHNRRWCEMLGFGDDMLEHPVEAFFALIHPDDQGLLRTRIEQALAATDSYEAEFRLRHSDGHYIWVADQGRVVLRSAEGAPLRIVGAFADISERRRVQDELERSKNQLHALAARLQAVREEERTRISGEVHDELGQMLTGLSLDLAWLKKRAIKVEANSLRREMTSKLEELTDLTKSMLRSVREIASEMRPQVLDNLGLASAIRYEAKRFQDRTGITCMAVVPADMPAMPAEHATNLFRILQETLTNVVRHAHAKQVDIRLERASHGIVLTVQDNGRGITPEELADARSLGLLGMRERAVQFAGRVDIRGETGKGTTVTVTL